MRLLIAGLCLASLVGCGKSGPAFSELVADREILNGQKQHTFFEWYKLDNQRKELATEMAAKATEDPQERERLAAGFRDPKSQELDAAYPDHAMKYHAAEKAMAEAKAQYDQADAAVKAKEKK